MLKGLRNAGLKFFDGRFLEIYTSNELELMDLDN